MNDSLHVPQPVEPLCWPSDAILTLPGSKSEANRLLVAAAASGRTVTIHGATPSDDVRHLVKGLGTLGHECAFVDEAQGIVRVGPRHEDAPTAGELHCGNAGTALRFLVSLAAMTPGEWVVTGDARMRERPIEPLVQVLRQLGVAIEASGGCPPVRVRGAHLRGGAVALDASLSSQFLTSLLLVAPALPTGLAVQLRGTLASADYALWTLRVLERFGVRTVHDHERGYVVSPGYGDVPARLDVGGDWSAMGVWTCLDRLTGSRVRGANLQTNSAQPDEALAEALRRFDVGADVQIDVTGTPDQFLNLAVVAALRRGTTRFVDAGNLRLKECDRLAVAARELSRLGVACEERRDELVVHGTGELGAGTVDPAGDHRVAMAFALAGLLRPGIAIATPACVAKSYPDFWQDVERVRREHRPVAIVGIRAAGKTTLARALAAACGSAFVDTDHRFVATHGPIAAFVQNHGWAAFRERERELVAAALRPGTIVALGGGAIETTAVREELRSACVVWLDAEVELLRARLAADPSRPSLTGRPPADEVVDVLARRLPLYRSLAERRVDASLPLAQQVEQARRWP